MQPLSLTAAKEGLPDMVNEALPRLAPHRGSRGAV